MIYVLRRFSFRVRCLPPLDARMLLFRILMPEEVGVDDAEVDDALSFFLRFAPVIYPIFLRTPGTIFFVEYLDAAGVSAMSDDCIFGSDDPNLIGDACDFASTCSCIFFVALVAASRRIACVSSLSFFFCA